MRNRGGCRWSILIATVVASAGLSSCVPVAPAPPAALQIFPTDTQTVPDAAQLTGKRVNLPMPDCSLHQSDCDEIALLNQLDGFDLDPTITIGFAGPIDVAKVNDASITVAPTHGDPGTGLNRLVWDPATNTLAGHPKIQLAPGTEYTVTVSAAINGQAGTSTFTTMSATTGLKKMAAQVDSGQAVAAAGIADPKLHVDTDSSSASAAYPAASVLPVAGVVRTEDLGGGNTKTEQAFDSTVPSTAGAGTYTFGSFAAPQWLDATTRTIPTAPTGGAAPSASRSETIGFVLVTPNPVACPQPPAGWPVAIFGPGVTRSKYDVLLASDENLRQCMATIAIDPVGHGYGPAGFVTITRTAPPGTVTVPSHGRGVDVNGDSAIGDREGVQTRGQPDPKASIGLRDGLRQTALDNMSLVRALEADYGGGSGFAVPGAGTLARTGIKYYAQSLGAIYGTMVMAADPDLTVGALDVPGGPILDTARLSPEFRGEVGLELHNRAPSLWDCGGSTPSDATCAGFAEQTPLYLDAPVTNPTPTAIAIQRVGAIDNWIERSGSPEAFAPMLLPGGKRVLYQFAFGDQTVPNPTSATVMRAGGLQGVTTLYRHDLDPGAAPACNPHGFLLDPRIAPLARTQGQLQIATFFAQDGLGARIDPDTAAGPVWEVPITDPNMLESLNFTVPPPAPSAVCTAGT